MARRIVNRRELRAEAEAAEARGLNLDEKKKPRAGSQAPLKPKAGTSARMRMVWAVCDIGGRTVETFAYADKPAAEGHAALLKSRGKGPHFVRALKVPMEGPQPFDD